MFKYVPSHNNRRTHYGKIQSGAASIVYCMYPSVIMYWYIFKHNSLKNKYIDIFVDFSQNNE